MELLAAIVLFCGVLAFPIFRAREWLAATIILTLGLLPVRILGTTEPHVGVSGFEPRLMTYSIPVIAFAIAALFAPRIFRIPVSLGALAVYVVIGCTFIWQGTGEQWAGVVLILQGITCFAIGGYLFRSALGDVRVRIVLVIAIAGVVAVQTAVGGLQYLGFPIFPPDAETAELVGSRVNGTFNHPATLGKALFLLNALLLLLAPAANRSIRFLAYAAIGASFLPLLLSGSRANLIGAIALVVGWAMLIPLRGNGQKKVLVLVGMALAVVASIGVIASRFEEDPEGGARQLLNDRTIYFLDRVLPFGSGPNSFVTTFGQWDPLIASGWLVHNVPLLLLSEIGVIGLVALLWPFSAAFVFSVRSSMVGRKGVARNAAAVYLAAVPGFIAIGATGWGFLHEYTLPLALLVLGACTALLQTISNTETIQAAHIDDNRLFATIQKAENMQIRSGR